MTLIIIFILGVLVGVVFVWMLKKTRKSKYMFGGVLGKINKKKREQVNTQKNHILKFMKEHRRISNDEVQELLGISDSTATRRLNALKVEGVIMERGVGKKIYYELKV